MGVLQSNQEGIMTKFNNFEKEKQEQNSTLIQINQDEICEISDDCKNSNDCNKGGECVLEKPVKQVEDELQNQDFHKLQSGKFVGKQYREMSFGDCSSQASNIFYFGETNASSNSYRNKKFNNNETGSLDKPYFFGNDCEAYGGIIESDKVAVGNFGVTSNDQKKLSVNGVFGTAKFGGLVLDTPNFNNLE